MFKFPSYLLFAAILAATPQGVSSCSYLQNHYDSSGKFKLLTEVDKLQRGGDPSPSFESSSESSSEPDPPTSSSEDAMDACHKLS
jgi:hypothetical protein